MISERTKTVFIDYDPGENILYLSYPPNTNIDSASDLVAHFDRMVSFWRRNCLGRKVYILVNYDNLDINARLAQEYGKQIQRMLDISLANFRYGGSSLQRASARLASMKIPTPSFIFDTREEAFAAIDTMKNGGVPKKPFNR